jgi:diacylglycerol kinase (ATP)
MRILLIYNEKAGLSAYRATDLLRLIEKTGFEVELHPRVRGWPLEEIDAFDWLAVAGGDGTVGSILRRLPRRAIPVAILPLGTANNVATAVGIEGSVESIIDGWRHHSIRTCDASMASGRWGERLLIEGAGLGSFARLMAFTKRSKPVSEEWDLPVVRKILDSHLHHDRRIECRIVMDGEVRDSPLLMLELMNLSCIGPALRLAPDADPADGMLDVVWLDALYDHSDGLTFGDLVSSGRMRAARARSVEIEWRGSPLHLDDQIEWLDGNSLEPIDSGNLRVEVVPAAYDLVIPRMTR